SHTIIRLPVYCPGTEPVTFEEDDIIDINTKKMTKLKAWFHLNTIEKEANLFLYTEIPLYYTWTKGEWKKRKKDSLTQLERFCLRLLLLHVKGARSYKEIKCFEDKQYETFEDVCKARGLMDSDNEWEHCLNEASHTIIIGGRIIT
ncbi:F59H6.5 family protein, partial [Entamoeba invadens IP1]